MTIQIRRKFGYMGYLGRVKLYANDELITTLAVGERYDYEPEQVQQGIIRLKVTQLGGRSNILFVRDQAKVTISVNPYYTITFSLFFACLFASNLTPYPVFFPLAIIFFLVFLFIGFAKTFVLKEVSE